MNMIFVHYMAYSYMKYACVYNIYVSEINNKTKYCCLCAVYLGHEKKKCEVVSMLPHEQS